MSSSTSPAEPLIPPAPLTTPAPPTTIVPPAPQPPQHDTGSKCPRSVSPDAPRKKNNADQISTQFAFLRRPALPDDMAQPLVKYDPTDFTNLPTAKAENPHQWSTRRGPEPLIPAGEHLIFTDTAFPHAHVPGWNFKANVATDQLAQLEPDEGHTLAIVAHGGGVCFILHQPDQAGDIAGFVNNLSFGEGGQKFIVKVVAPVLYRTDDRKTFAHPYTYFMILPEGSDILKRFLLWQEVFSIHPTLSFSVHEMVQEMPVWTVLVLTGVKGAVVNSEDAKQAILANIKRKLWANVRYCSLAAQLVAGNWGIQSDFASRVKAATDTFELYVTRAEQHSTEVLVPCYVLMVKPLSTDRAVHESVLACITEPKRYWNGPYALDVNKASVSCKLCKDTTHCTAECALPKTPGWQGPTVEMLRPNARAGATGATGAMVAPTLQQQVQDLWRHVPRRNERQGKGKAQAKKSKASGSGGASGSRRRQN